MHVYRYGMNIVDLRNWTMHNIRMGKIPKQFTKDPKRQKCGKKSAKRTWKC